ncbi:MAG: carotenoid biosynthesis protein [Myxococcota bacterium]
MQPITEETYLPEGALDRPRTGLLTAARRELWRHLPAWMFFIYAVLLLNTELTNFHPARADLAHTIVFPLSVFVLFQGVRASFGRASRRLLAVSLTLAFGLPLLILSTARPSPLDVSQLLRVYEWSNFLWAGLLVAHAWRHQRSHVALFFGVAFVYGLCLENGGILLGFFHETNLTDTVVRPFVAPFATMVGWSVVLLMATFVTWELRKRLGWLQRSAALSALAVGTFATLLDLQIDPIATAAGCWVWHESLPPWFHGVPLVNFIAWMCALVPFAYVMFRVQARRRIEDAGRWDAGALKELLAWTPATLVLAALCFMAVTVAVEGANGPSWTLLNHFTLSVFRFVGLAG